MCRHMGLALCSTQTVWAEVSLPVLNFSIFNVQTLEMVVGTAFRPGMSGHHSKGPGYSLF